MGPSVEMIGVLHPKANKVVRVRKHHSYSLTTVGSYSNETSSGQAAVLGLSKSCGYTGGGMPGL